MTRAVVAGEVLAVFLGEPDVPLEESVTFSRGFAGAESNTAVGLARQGLAVTMLGRVGADALGRAAVRALRGEGIDVSHLRVDEEAPTGILVRNASPTGVEVVYGRRQSAGTRFEPGDVPAEAFEGCDVFHVSGITPMLSSSAAAATLECCRLARSAGAVISVDPNVRRRIAPLEVWREGLVPFLELADLVLAGRDEALDLAGTGASEDAVAVLRPKGTELLVLKDGARGASAYDGRRWTTCDAVPTQVVDPVGAGDGFDAGFLAAWTAGAGLAEALHRGALVGAMSVAARGDTAGIRSAELDRPSETIDVIR